MSSYRNSFNVFVRMSKRWHWPKAYWVYMIHDICLGRLPLRAKLTRMMIGGDL